MSSESGSSITLKSLATDFAVAFVLFSSVFGLIAFVPDTPPLFLQRQEALLALVLGGSALLTLAVQAVRLGWHRFITVILALLAGLVSKAGAIKFAIYLLGILLCERLGVSPNLEQWSIYNADFWSFFGIYSALFFLFLATIRMGQNATDERENTPWDASKLSSVFAQLKPLALTLAVPMYLAGLVVMEWLGFAPSLSFSNIGTRQSLSFLAVYTAGFLLIPLAISLVVVAVYLSIRTLLNIFKAVGNSERWQRFRGARISKKELEARLLEERAARDEIAKKWRIQKEGEQEGRIIQRQEEIAEFGPITARMLWWSPVLTLGAQAASFVTSYLGIRIYLDLRQANTEWLGYNIPTWIVDALGMEAGARLSIMSNDILALAASLFMATLIWALSALAVGRVRRQQPIPFVVFFFVIGLGLISTYTAFIFWNGEVATGEQLRLAQRETDRYFTELETIDQRNIGESLREVANLESQAKSVLLEQQVETLRGHLLEVQGVLDALSQDFASYGGIEYFLTSGKDFYETFLECEVSAGCLSNLRGRGEVAKSLTQNIEAFDNNLSTWTRITEARTRHTEAASSAIFQAIDHLQSRQLADAQREVANARAAIIRAIAQDPAVIFGSITSRLSVPIASDAPTQNQRDALASLREGVQLQLTELGSLVAVTEKVPVSLPSEIRLDQIGLPLRQDIGLLVQVRSELDSLMAERERIFSSTEANLEALSATIEVNAREKRLVQRSDDLFSMINGTRDEVETLGYIDLRPVFAKLLLLQADFTNQNAASVPTIEDILSYPAIDEFQPQIIALSILTYAHLSVVPLLIQIMLDFGYTLIVIIVAARLRRRNVAT